MALCRSSKKTSALAQPLRGKRVREPRKSRWSPPSMDAHNPKVIIALLVSWVGIEYLMEGKPSELSLTGHNAITEAVILRVYSIQMAYLTCRASQFLCCSQGDHIMTTKQNLALRHKK
ncbi:hypothetical protein EVAR_82404_1 [Eumeta japonica]|uniref:Uncharacterized protein n=1 Tax=Eumeta variegata TaxID=151549 RepID=A0A4C1UA97_EUMVA|nr:hypothetical protein EVAR_82404_1 [Eumeta japonica]